MIAIEDRGEVFRFVIKADDDVEAIYWSATEQNVKFSDEARLEIEWAKNTKNNMTSFTDIGAAIEEVAWLSHV
ncbi:hypothetical protein [Pantoea septica]|uniref:hypothetical protein n=1 Tax=Pantoea septica TaxID=472695 RepID=UPI000B00DEAF|nr:hypothetical protein [Pantoea septica]